jgi:hypothetical protein
MKKISLTLFAVAIVVFSIAQELALNIRPATSLPKGNAAFKWDVTSYEFGRIKVGVPVTYEFSFTNTGDVPLVIASVQTPCGCTVTEFSKDPIEPGAEGYVKATYDAAKTGKFTKTVTVNANTEDALVQLTLQGEVVE